MASLGNSIGSRNWLLCPFQRICLFVCLFFIYLSIYLSIYLFIYLRFIQSYCRLLSFCRLLAHVSPQVNPESVRCHVPDLLHALVCCFKDDSWPVRDGRIHLLFINRPFAGPGHVTYPPLNLRPGTF